MKKKIAMVLMTGTLLATTMTGCDVKADTRVGEDSTKAEVAKPTLEPAVTGDGVIMEAPTDDGIIEVEGGVIAIPDEDVKEITGEVTK